MRCSLVDGGLEMPRLIDADALKEYATGGVTSVGFLTLAEIDKAPTIDAVPVVRCKDCKHYKHGKHFTDINFCQRLPYYAERGGLNTADDDFCSYGERREDGEDDATL